MHKGRVIYPVYKSKHVNNEIHYCHQLSSMRQNHRFGRNLLQNAAVFFFKQRSLGDAILQLQSTLCLQKHISTFFFLRDHDALQQTSWFMADLSNLQSSAVQQHTICIGKQLKEVPLFAACSLRPQQTEHSQGDLHEIMLWCCLP